MVSAHFRTGPLFILLAASLGGTAGTAQAFAPAGADAVSVGATRIAFGGLMLLAYAAVRGELRALTGLRGTRRAVPLLLAGASVVAVYQLCFFSALARTGVAVGTIVTMGSAPVFTGLLAWPACGGRPAARWYVATAPAVAGCALLTLGGARVGVDVAGVLLGLAAGLGYAAYVLISSRMIAATGSVPATMGVVFGGSALILLPVLVWSRPTWLATPDGALVGAHLAVVTTLIGYLLYGRGLRTTPAPTVATLSLAEPAVATLLGLMVLGERLDATGIAGLTLTGASMAVLVVPVRRRGRPLDSGLLRLRR